MSASSWLNSVINTKLILGGVMIMVWYWLQFRRKPVCTHHGLVLILLRRWCKIRNNLPSWLEKMRKAYLDTKEYKKALAGRVHVATPTCFTCTKVFNTCACVQQNVRNHSEFRELIPFDVAVKLSAWKRICYMKILLKYAELNSKDAALHDDAEM